MIVKISTYNQNNPSYSYYHSVRWVNSVFLQMPSYSAIPVSRYVHFRQLTTPSRGYATIEKVLVQEVFFDPTKRYSQMGTYLIFEGKPSELGTGLSNYAGLRNIGSYHALDPRWCVPYARVADDGSFIQRCQIFAMLSTYELNLNYEYVALRNRDHLSLIFNPSANTSQFNEYWSSASDIREVVLRKRRLQATEIIPVARYTYPGNNPKWSHVPNFVVSRRVGVKGL